MEPALWAKDPERGEIWALAVNPQQRASLQKAEHEALVGASDAVRVSESVVIEGFSYSKGHEAKPAL